MNFDFPSIEAGSFQACSIFAVVNAQNIANHFLHYTNIYYIIFNVWIAIIPMISVDFTIHHPKHARILAAILNVG